MKTAAAPAVPQWRIQGDWWDLCNCAIGCPCVFSSPPTLGEAKRNVVSGAFGRKWDWSGRSSKHIRFDLRGPQSFTWRKPARKTRS
jgi:hypothetical protein